MRTSGSTSAASLSVHRRGRARRMSARCCWRRAGAALASPADARSERAIRSGAAVPHDLDAAIRHLLSSAAKRRSRAGSPAFVEEVAAEVDGRLGAPAWPRARHPGGSDAISQTAGRRVFPYNTDRAGGGAARAREHDRQHQRLAAAGVLTRVHPHRAPREVTRLDWRAPPCLRPRAGAATRTSFLPQWQVEGIATFEESVVTGKGRVPAGDFRMILNRAAAQGRFAPTRSRRRRRHRLAIGQRSLRLWRVLPSVSRRALRASVTGTARGSDGGNAAVLRVARVSHRVRPLARGALERFRSRHGRQDSLVRHRRRRRRDASDPPRLLRRQHRRSVRTDGFFIQS